jgi:hypothetical protein
MVRVRVACIVTAATLLAAPAGAQTPGAIPDPGSYAGSMELQRREAESARAQEQQNAQMQERLNQNYNAYAPNGGGGGRGGGRAGPPPINWWAKPALPPAKNPLLGRWKQVASKGMTGQQLGLLGGLPGVGDIVNGAMAGGCKSIFGTGVIAFTPTSLSWVAPDGHEEILNHVAYRADGANVVVITRDPGAIEALFFGFPNHDHAVVALFNCTMDRVGAKATLASSTPAPAATPGPGAPASAGPANALLRLAVSLNAAPYAAAQIWVTPENPDNALLKAGFPAGPFGAAATLADNCRAAQTCAKGLTAMTAHALGSVKTDAAGHAQTPAIPAGRYYLIGVVPFEGKALLWHYGIELTPGSNLITLDDRTGSIIR